MIKNIVIVKELYGFVILYELKLKKKRIFNTKQSFNILQQSVNTYKTDLKKRSNMHFNLSQVRVLLL